MLHETSFNAAELIPYKTFKDKIRTVKSEIEKGRHVEIIDELKVVYSIDKSLREGKINV